MDRVLDPYQECVCGSGKKIKYCQPKLIEQVIEASHQAENGREASAFATFNRLENTPNLPRCLQMLIRAEHLTVLLAAGRGDHDDIRRRLDELINNYGDDFGLPWMFTASVASSMHAPLPEILAALQNALDRTPAEATRFRIDVMARMSGLQSSMMKPMAGWALLQRALKLAPADKALAEQLKTQFQENRLWPSIVRHGGRLRTPDELGVFNDERRRRWNAAIERELDWSLDELIDTFEYLAEDDKYDAAAWYNLALVQAWAGNNLRAIEALEHYLDMETDFERQADAAELAALLRADPLLGSEGDLHAWEVVYEVTAEHWMEVIERLKESRRISPHPVEFNNMHRFVWYDRAIPHAEEGLIGRPKPIASMSIIPGKFAFEAYTEEGLAQVTRSFKELMGDRARQVTEPRRVSVVATIDEEALLDLHDGTAPGGKVEDQIVKSSINYWEETWIQRPLRSLRGLTPLDASASPRFRARLEGVIRFRERQFHRHEVPYDFSRLRRKLGLETLSSEENAKPDISTFSSAQLAELKPADLTDDDLIAAYRAAVALDGPTLAAHFGEVLVKRPHLAEKIEFMPIFRRLVQERLDRGHGDRAVEILEQAREFNREHGDESSGIALDGLAAKVYLARGQVDQACDAYRALFTREPNNLDLIASAIETLLGKGQYRAAAEFADHGVSKAQHGKRDMLDQFRDYKRVATSRGSL